ncbi:Na(+)/H(+) antiporter subunit C [Leucobacter sp. USHLN153]|uniref:Na(+)/H(+) antiporter subunit C n=1 Tax=Leucobacter sp. USHLN153 TaxID=3081268 RepID=UPI003018D213
MTMPLVLVAVMVVLYACGVYLMLDRSLTRLLLGFLLVGNATNLLIFLMSGSFGAAPISSDATAEEMSDPLPQAFILTAIVITFGVSAFLLALIYRSWRLAQDHDDRVQDDETDQEIATTRALAATEVTDDDLAETHEYEELDDTSADSNAEANASANANANAEASANANANRGSGEPGEVRS